MPQIPGLPDHAASPSGLLDKPEVRTFLQGAALDVAAAVALVVVQATGGGDVDWRLLGLLVVKTAAYTIASNVMKKLRPARPEESSSGG